MTEETRLVLAVDTTQVAKAETDLAKMAASGQKAETAAQELQQGMAALGATVGGVAPAMAKVGAATTTLSDSLGKVDANAASAAAGMQKVGDATGQASKQLAGIAAAGSTASEALAGQARAATNAAAATKLTAFQSQQLGFQLNDLFVQIASGQSPITALVQQGSQLSGTFGGVRNTLGALATVFTPLRLAIGGAAGALVGLAVAYNEGAKEDQAFRRTLILTGNQAGTTAGQLALMAEALNKVGAGNTARAAEILNQMAAAGTVGAAGLQRFTETALRLEKVGGPAAEETAKAFAELGKSPLDAALKLDAATNAFTLSTLRQIKALEEQGRTADAARVAQEAFAASSNDRIPQLAATLGTLERGWLNVKEAISGAKSALLDIGRSDGIDQQIVQLEATAKRIRLAQQNQAILNPGEFFKDLFGIQSAEQQAAELDKLIAKLKETATTTQFLAKAERESEAAKKANRELDAQADRYLSQSEQRLKAITQAANLYAQALKGVGEQEQKNALTAYQQTVRGIDQQFDPGTQLQAIRNAEALQLEQIKGKEIELQAQRERGYISEQQLIKGRTALQIESLDIEVSTTEKELALARQRTNSAQEQLALIGQLAQLEARRKNILASGAAESEAALLKQARAIQAVTFAMREQADSEWAAFVQSSGQQVKATAEALQDYRQSILDSAEAARIELAYGQQNNVQKRIELENLRISINLRKQLAAVDKLVYPDLSPDQAEAQRQVLRDGFNDAATKERANAAARITAEAFQSVSRDITNTLTDAILEGGESGAKKLEDLFKNLVLRPIVSAAVQQVTGPITSALFGSSASGGISGLSSLSSTASLGNSIYNLGSGSGLAGTAISYGSNAAVYSGSAYGTGFASQQSAMLAAQEAGITSSAGSSSLAAGGAWAAAIIAGIYKANDDYNKGFNTAGARNVGRETYGAAGTFEGLQNDLLKTFGFSDRLASLLSGSTAVAALIGRSSPQIQQQGVQGTLSGGAFSGNLYADVKEKGGLFRSDKNYTVTTGFDDALSTFFTTAAKSVYSKAQEYGKALNLPVDQLSQVSTDIKVALTDDAEKNKTAIFEALGGYGDALVAGFRDAVAPLAQYGETVTQTIERVAGNLLGVNDVLKRIGVTALDSSVAGGKAALELANTFGGLDNLAQSAGTYYDNFFSQSEKTKAATDQVTKALADVGLQMPKTREEFRALVEGVGKDVTGANAQAQLGVLLSLSSVFAQIVPAAEDAADAATRLAEAEKRIADERLGLQRQLLEASGDTAALRELDRAALDESNRALYDQINALKDQKDALDKATAASAAIASQRFSLETQLLTLQGDTTALRARERAGLDESNRAIYDQIAALQDLQTAQQAATQAQEVEAQRLAAVASERAGLERQLLQLQGDTAGLRAIERAGLDESNRALYDRITALQDEQAAQAAATVAAQEAKRAAADAAAQMEKLAGIVNDVTGALSRELQAAFQDAASVIQDARSKVESDSSTVISGLQDQASAAKDALQSLSASLGGLADDLQGIVANLLGTGNAAGSRAQALATLTGALASGSIDTKAVAAAAQTAGRLDSSQYGSALDLRRDTLRTANLIGDVAGLARRQVAAADAQTQQRLAGIQKAIDDETANRDAQLRTLDDQLSLARRQYEALTGIDTGVQTVAGALGRLGTALTAYATATGGAGAATNQAITSGGQSVYRSSTGAVGVLAAGQSDYIIRGITGSVFTRSDAREWINAMLAKGDFAGIRDRAIAEGIDSTSVDDILGLPHGTALSFALSKGLPAFASGSDYLPRDMVAQVHQGERIIPAADNAQLMRIMQSGPARDEALVAEIRRLNERIEKMAERMAAQGDAVAVSTAKTARLLDKFDIDGMPEVRT